MSDKIFYDADCLSSFLVVGRTDILESLFSKIIVPSQVYNELTNPSTPNIIKLNFKKVLNNGFVEQYDFDLFSKEYADCINIQNGNWSETSKKIGKGEAAVISLAYNHDAIIASNNLKDIMEYVEKLELKLITSAFILAKSVERKIIIKDEANSIWIEMIERGIYLPCTSFDEYYSSKYSEDSQFMTF